MAEVLLSSFSSFKACRDLIQAILLDRRWCKRWGVVWGADLRDIQSRNVTQPMGSGSRMGRWSGEGAVILPDHMSICFIPCYLHNRRRGRAWMSENPTPPCPLCCVLSISSLWWNTSKGEHLITFQGTSFCLWRWQLGSTINLEITYMPKSRAMLGCGIA